MNLVKWDKQALDLLHATLVDRYLRVEVVGEAKDPLEAVVFIGDIDIGKMLVHNGFAREGFTAGKSDAEQKFWQLPELIEELLKFLDLESTLQLARAHERTRNILQGSKAWNNLLKRSYLRSWSDLKPLVAILKLMKDTKSNLLDLLDAICEEHPSLENDNPFFDGSVQVRCPRHEGFHSVSGRGFFLFEQVEKAFGTTELTVEAIALDTGDTWILQSLVSRLTRLEGGIKMEEQVHNEDGEAGWVSLCKMKDLSRDEFVAWMDSERGDEVEERVVRKEGDEDA